jgi:hypothetical protein
MLLTGSFDSNGQTEFGPRYGYSARLGHSSIQITLDRYSHLFPSVEEALAEALDAIYAAGEATEPSEIVQLPAGRA